MASPEQKSGWKEVFSKVGIAGGLVAGLLGLLTSNVEAFVVVAGLLGGGYYLRKTNT